MCIPDSTTLETSKVSRTMDPASPSSITILLSISPSPQSVSTILQGAPAQSSSATAVLLTAQSVQEDSKFQTTQEHG